MRIKVIDGFRAIAVLGVVWVHIWRFYENPSYTVFKIDIAKFMSFFGTGVDLFFVISGFCMYLMYSKKKDDLTFRSYLQYVKSRWLRIAPAFYVAIIIYALADVSFNFYLVNKVDLFKNFLFIRTLFNEQAQYGPHFWSLCTEWHFYIILPAILIGIKKFSFFKSVLATTIICFVFRGVVWYNNDDPFNIINFLIFNRLIEFVIGITTAYLYINSTKLWVNKKIIGILLGVLIAFIGRILMSAEFVNRTDAIGYFARVFDLPLLTMGYGLAILNTLTYTSLFSKFLESKLMGLIGQYSYSMYLWHWIVSEKMVQLFKGVLPIHPFFQTNIIFILSIIILFPISKWSFILFESIYFKKRKNTTVLSLPSHQ